MSVSLVKGGNVNLSKEAGGSLSEVVVGLGWDARTTAGAEFDLDASAFVVDDSGNVLADSWFIFYGNPGNVLGAPGPDGKATADRDQSALYHTGDNLTGDGDGDDEQIVVKLPKLPAMAEKVVIAVTIYEAEKRSENFGQVKNAYVRVCDQSGAELTKFDLGEDFSLETAVVFGELYRNGSDWKFRAVGQGYNDGLAGLCKDHGLSVA